MLTGHCATSATSGCPTSPSWTCCGRSPPNRARPCRGGQPLSWPRCWPGDRRPSAGSARRRGRDLSRPLRTEAAPQPVDDGRLQLFESVATLICELASGAPLLIVLEDVPGRTGPAAIYCGTSWPGWWTSRWRWWPPTGPTTCTALIRYARCSPSWCACRVSSGWSLPPLPDAEVGTLVRRLADTAGSLPESVVEDVVARAEGNAFYAEELWPPVSTARRCRWG